MLQKILRYLWLRPLLNSLLATTIILTTFGLTSAQSGGTQIFVPVVSNPDSGANTDSSANTEELSSEEALTPEQQELLTKTLAQFMFDEPVPDGEGVYGESSNHEDGQELRAAGYVLTSSIWPDSDIPVCWNTLDWPLERGWVKQVVESTWQAYSQVRFIGWGLCPAQNDNKTIRITIRDSGPHVKRLGRYIANSTNGMVLNFEFNNWGEGCNSSANVRRECIDIIAVHEFGHALGFAHEQNRPDTPDSCTSSPQGPSGNEMIGAWDLHSVMNYCNPLWSNEGELSATDIEMVSRIYNAPSIPCGPLQQEAEMGIRYGDFEVATDINANNELYVYVPEDSVGDARDALDESRRVDYCFNVPEAGDYKIQGTVYATDGESNSFYVKVNGAPSAGYIWAIPQELYNRYVPDYVNDRDNGTDSVIVTLDEGEQRISIYLREDGTRLDTISLEAVDTPPIEACGPLQQEAEDGTLYGDFAIGNDDNASSGKYIYVPEDSVGDSRDAVDESRRVDYCFTVPEAGDYAITGIVYATDGESNSFYVKVNDAPSVGYVWAIPQEFYNQYVLDYVNDRDNETDPVIVTLDEGEQIISIYLREDGTRLDTISLVAANMQ